MKSLASFSLSAVSAACLALTVPAAARAELAPAESPPTPVENAPESSPPETEGETVAATPAIAEENPSNADAEPAASAAASEPVPAPTAPPAVAPDEASSEHSGQIDVLYLEQFEEAIADLRIFSASQLIEPVSEAPVPVTVITAEMIRAIGARTLQDVLLAYVPGFTEIVDHNEQYSAMRGVYGSSQQKVLVLQDGHRLNSRAYSMANFDYSISLDKVRQIEVLRGPGSSLYGNVALAAVVNLITKKGTEIDGVAVRLGAGNFGQLSSSLLAGTKLGESGDVTVWATTFKSAGEPVAIPAEHSYSATPVSGTSLIGAFRDPASYDLGARATLGGLTLFASRSYSHMAEPFTGGGAVTGEVYDYHSLSPHRSMGPGLGSRSNHLEARYARELSETLSWEATAYYDTNELMAMIALGPVGAGSFINWEDQALGASLNGRWRYELGAAGSGNLLVGTQLERMQLLDSTLLAATDGVWSSFGATPEVPLLEKGEETTFSGFAQLKHRISSVVVNVGARFDYKQRHKGADIHDLSPRAAIIWEPLPELDLKLSYAQSFVDAPYWYRYNSLASYKGSEGLLPEHLRSVQLSPTVRLLDGRLVNTVTVFYNYLYDFVFRDPSATGDMPRYKNAGMLKSAGVEEEVAFVGESFRVRGNLTWQRAIEAKDFGAMEGEIDNIPALTANLIADVSPMPSIYEKLWLSAWVRFIGERRSPILSRFTDASGDVIADYTDLDYREPAVALLNLGVRLPDLVLDGLTLDCTVYNVFGTRWRQGGSVAHPYPMTGRWVLAHLTYALPL